MSCGRNIPIENHLDNNTKTKTQKTGERKFKTKPRKIYKKKEK